MRRRLLPRQLIPCLLVLLSATAAAQVPPEDLTALRTRVREGRCEEVLQGIRALRTRFADDPDLYIIEANCALAAGERKVTRFVPEAYRSLRSRLGQGVRAEALFETVVEYDPEAVDRAFALLAEARRRAPLRADIALGQCYLSQKSGRYEELLASVRLAAERFPGDTEMARSLLSYAEAYVARGRPERALEVAEIVTASYPDDDQAWAAIGRYRLYGGDLEGARAGYRRARALREANSTHALEAAQIEMLAESWSEAIRHLDDAEKSETLLTRTLFELAFAQSRLNVSDAGATLSRFFLSETGRRSSRFHAGAAELARILRQDVKPSPESWLALGRSLATDGHLGAAVASFGNGLALSPGHTELLLARGDLFARLRLVERARASYGEALASLPAEDASAAGMREEIRVLIARSLALAERYGEAREAYEALARPEEHALMLATVCERLGDTKEARRWLEKAAAREEWAEEARRRLALIEKAAATSGP